MVKPEQEMRRTFKRLPTGLTTGAHLSLAAFTSSAGAFLKRMSCVWCER